MNTDITWAFTEHWHHVNNQWTLTSREQSMNTDITWAFTEHWHHASIHWTLTSREHSLNIDITWAFTEHWHHMNSPWTLTSHKWSLASDTTWTFTEHASYEHLLNLLTSLFWICWLDSCSVLADVMLKIDTGKFCFVYVKKTYMYIYLLTLVPKSILFYDHSQNMSYVCYMYVKINPWNQILNSAITKKRVYDSLYIKCMYSKSTHSIFATVGKRLKVDLMFWD